MFGFYQQFRRRYISVTGLDWERLGQTQISADPNGNRDGVVKLICAGAYGEFANGIISLVAKWDDEHRLDLGHPGSDGAGCTRDRRVPFSIQKRTVDGHYCGLRGADTIRHCSLFHALQNVAHYMRLQIWL